MSIDIKQLRSEAKRQAQSDSDYLCSTSPMPFDDQATVTSVAQQEQLYVDPTHPIKCSGRVDTIETCFGLNHNRGGGFSVEVVVLRPTTGGFVIEQALNLPINQILEDDNTDTSEVLYCQNITVSNTLIVKKGDLLSFRTINSVEVVFTNLPFQGSPKSVTVQPVLGAETVLAEQLAPGSGMTNVLPMFRGLIGEFAKL